nr:hypothetical protein JVH1_3252 [Rhodococcus sp. JVH1]
MIAANTVRQGWGCAFPNPKPMRVRFSDTGRWFHETPPGDPLPASDDNARFGSEGPWMGRVCR